MKSQSVCLYLLSESKHFGYHFEIIMITTRAFEENGQLVPNSKGHYPILQNEHIQWSIERLNANPDITIEPLHC